MNHTMKYKGYIGSVEFSEEDALFYGKVMGIRAMVSYEGTNEFELMNNFYAAVDAYLELCHADNMEPESKCQRGKKFAP